MADMHIQCGQKVFGSHGAVLGRVLQMNQSGFVVEKGLVFTEDYLVRYEEIDSIRDDGVHLRIPGSALVPEEEAEPWEPVRDPVGTAGGTDLEPLRAGMAEIDEHQHPQRAPAAGAPSRDERRRKALARDARIGARAGGQAEAQPTGLEPAVRQANAWDDTEVQQHIEEEIDDFEREASCSEWRATEGAPPNQPPSTTPVTPAASGVGTATPVRGTPGRRPPRYGRIDYRAAAPEAAGAMARFGAYLRNCGLERGLLELVRLRASQLNGCGYCIDMHTKHARREGETEQRLYALQVWDETRFFTDRERAALAWTEAVTRLGPDHVGDGVFQQAREQFSETELVNLTLAIIAINGWNRLAIAFRALAG